MKPHKIFEPKQELQNFVELSPEDGDVVQLEVFQNVVLLNLPEGAADEATVKLPNAVAMQGQIVSVRVVAAGGVGATITLTDQDDGATSYSKELAAVGDSVIAFSDGLRWVSLFEDISVEEEGGGE